jgi:hypothetical protein
MVGVYAKMLQDILSDTADTFERSAKWASPLPATHSSTHLPSPLSAYPRLTNPLLPLSRSILLSCSSALSPPKIYADDHDHARFRIAGALLPVFILTAVVPTRYFAHGISFLMGVAFFGQPLLIRAAQQFVYYVPDWQEKLDLRK